MRSTALRAVGPFVRQAIAQEGGGDVEILNFALTLEYLEAAFYTQALKQDKGLSGDVKSLATEIRDNEKEHVAALMSTIKDLGGTPVKAPGVDFGDAFANQKAFLKLAQTFEDTGVSAYNGAAPDDRVQGRAGCGREHRADRGPARGGDPPAQRPADQRRRLRQGARACRPCSTPSSRSSSRKERKTNAWNRTHGVDHRSR